MKHNWRTLIRDGWLVLRWQLYCRPYNWWFMRDVKKQRKAIGLDVHFIYDQPIEMNDWQKYYPPPSSVPKDGLIVDVGARDGDTLLFYAQLGFRNFRLIEPNPDFIPRLLENIKAIKKVYDVEIEVRWKCFELSDLEGAAFAKFDCEGCEYEFDLASLTIPWVAEMHEKQEPDIWGIYSSSIRSTEYRRGP